MMTGERVRLQIDKKALSKLALFYQKEEKTLIELYIKDSQQLMEKLSGYLAQEKESSSLSSIQEFRLRSVEIGALEFSYLLLSFEITISEKRLHNWVHASQVIEQNYLKVLNDLEALKLTQPATEFEY